MNRWMIRSNKRDQARECANTSLACNPHTGQAVTVSLIVAQLGGNRKSLTR